MGRKKQNPEEGGKRARILAIASHMFLTQGYSEVSMDALADAIPVSKRTLYNHFKDKKALFTAVMQSRCQMIFTTLEQAIQEGQNIEETLSAIGRRFLDAALEPDAVNIYRTAIMQSQLFPEMGKLFYESGPKRSTTILANYLEALHKKGEINAPNSFLAASVFLGMLTNRIQMRCLLGLKKKVSAAEKQDIVDYVVRVFLQGHYSRSK